ncbi:MAG: LysE family translocator, partial [Glaciecola sp.]
MGVTTFNWVEFFSIAVIHFFAVVSPGPDFAVVLKQSIQQGRA